MIDAGFTALLASCLSVPWIGRILSIRPLRITGKISYCIYLVHVVIAQVVLSFLPGKTLIVATIRSVVILAASYGVAGLSWRFLEEPVLRLKRFFQAESDRVSPETVDMLCPA